MLSKRYLSRSGHMGAARQTVHFSAVEARLGGNKAWHCSPGDLGGHFSGVGVYQGVGRGVALSTRNEPVPNSTRPVLHAPSKCLIEHEWAPKVYDCTLEKDRQDWTSSRGRRVPQIFCRWLKSEEGTCQAYFWICLLWYMVPNITCH